MDDPHMYGAVGKQHSPEYFIDLLVLPRKESRWLCVQLRVKKCLLFFSFMQQT